VVSALVRAFYLTEHLALLGVLSGWLYARYRRRSPVGLLLYPLVYQSLLVLAAVMHRARRRQPQIVPPAPLPAAQRGVGP
jgi:hypothetical protein